MQSKIDLTRMTFIWPGKNPTRFRILDIPNQGDRMSAPHSDDHGSPTRAPADAVEAIVPLIPVVLPIVGGVLIFLLAFIAVSMA
jgi:hypothetical protein